jgi:hypothetical protein
VLFRIVICIPGWAGARRMPSPDVATVPTRHIIAFTRIEVVCDPLAVAVIGP